MSGPRSHELKRAKRAVRRRVLALRDALGPEERRSMSAAIAAHLLDLPEAARVGVAMAFWSFGSEVDTEPIVRALAERGYVVTLPRVEGADAVPVTYAPGDPLRPTGFGGREPADGRLVEPSELDLVVVPGVAFDASGRRVGYGGGFYDRLLSALRPGVPRIAVAFAVQVLPEVPEGGSDLRVDAIVTEQGVLRCR